MVWLIVAAVLLLGILLGAYYAYRVAFYAPPRGSEEIYTLPFGDQYVKLEEQLKGCVERLQKIPCEHVTITGRDEKKLFARYYHVRDGAPVQLQFHGYRGCALRDMCGIAPLAIKLGYNVLLIDQRAHGRSEGSTISFGIKERYDLQCWCRYATNRFGPDTPLVLYGVSMGAATVLMAADLTLPSAVKAIVADCPYSSPESIIGRVAEQMGLPPKPSVLFCRLAALIYGHFRLNEATPVRSVKGTSLPILLLHGGDDRFVPCDMSRQIYDACGADRRLEIFPGAAHGMSFLSDPHRYEQTVSSFLQSHLSG